MACRTTTWVMAVARPVLLPLSRSTSSPPPMAFDEARKQLTMFVSAS